MKKTFLLAIVLLAAFAVKAQQQVQFKIKLQPNRIYKITGGINLNATANLSGDPEALNKLKQQGMTQPLNMVMTLEMAGTGKTGAINAEKKFPINYQYEPAKISGNLNGKELPIPAKKTGVSVQGFVDENGKITLDSLNNQKLNDSVTRAMAMKMMSTIQSKISFPDKPMKVGDSFTQSVPFNIPAGGSNLDINVSITYKLINIQGNTANFDLIQAVDMKLDVKGAKINISGTGTGKLVYDIGENYPTTMTGDMTMKFNLDTEKLKALGTIVYKTNASYVVSHQ